jgi:hypothetical protein
LTTWFACEDTTKKKAYKAKRTKLEVKNKVKFGSKNRIMVSLPVGNAL